MKRILYVSAMGAVILGTWLIVSFVYMANDWPRRHLFLKLSDLFDSWNSYEGGSLEAEMPNLWRYLRNLRITIRIIRIIIKYMN